MLAVSGFLGTVACSSPTNDGGADQTTSTPERVADTTGRQRLSGHLSAALKAIPTVERVPAATQLHMTIGLPVKDQAALDAEVSEMSDPQSPRFRRYLTHEEFAEKYGTSPSDYEAVVAWARSKNLEATAHSDRLFVGVSGAAADVERAFNIHLDYALRADGTRFYKPDAEPSLDLSVPVRYVSNLNDYVVMHTAGGTGFNSGSYMGQDLRNAYASGSALNGQGQSVGIFAFNNQFAQSDIDAFNKQAGIAAAPVQIVGAPGTQTAEQIEITLDIDAVQSMAPAAQVVVFTGSTDQILTAMTENTQINQFSSSFFPSVDTASSPDVNLATGLQELASLGKSFFTCSGDNGAFVPGAGTNAADVRSQNYVTIVGGTELNLNAGAYVNETVWSSPCSAGTCGSSGGFLQGIAIPSYQVGLANSGNQGSTAYRNVPDVSAIGYDFDIFLNNAWLTVNGTSVATPTWAGFMALVNQQAKTWGLPTAGFANPALLRPGGVTRLLRGRLPRRANRVEPRHVRAVVLLLRDRRLRPDDRTRDTEVRAHSRATEPRFARRGLSAQSDHGRQRRMPRPAERQHHERHAPAHLAVRLERPQPDLVPGLGRIDPLRTEPSQVHRLPLPVPRQWGPDGRDPAPDLGL